MLEQPHFPRYRTRPIFEPWRSALTGRPRRSIAIRPNIRRKTRRNRHAPRRRGRIRRRSTHRLRICSIQASAAAAPASARRPASMKRSARLLPPPLWGRAGWGVEQATRHASTTAQSPSEPERRLPTPTPGPSPQGGGEERAVGEDRERGEQQPSKLAPPPDNSWDRRADFANAHTARASVARGFGEPPQQGYVGKTPVPPGELDPDLARALGIDEDEGDAEERRRARRDNARHGAGALALAAAGPRRGCDYCRPRQPAIARQVAARRPGRVSRSPVDAAPAAAAGEVGRRPAPRHQGRFRAAGRPAAGDRRAGRRRAAQRPHPGSARRHRLGQDLHHGEGDRGDAAPRTDPRAQQDAGGAALWRVQDLLSRQRGGIFRLLLRLLPAGGLRSAHRHLYREGILDQRADRPHAPRGDALAARARRRDHRRFGVLHLRYRLGRDLFGDDVLAQARRAHRPAGAARRPGRAAIQALGRRFLSRLVPRARRRHRDFSRPLRGSRLARVAVRRRA